MKKKSRQHRATGTWYIRRAAIQPCYNLLENQAFTVPFAFSITAFATFSGAGA